MQTEPPKAAPPKRKRRWYQFSLRSLLLAATLVSVWFGWQLHIDRVRKANEADACEAALRSMLIDSLDSESERFISFGMDARGNWLDPPPEFLERFSDLGIRLRPQSAARLPGPDEKTADGLDRTVEDSVTHAWGSIFSAKIERWIDDHTIEVFVERYRGRLNAEGHRATVEEHNGHWQVAKTADDFVS